MTTPKRTDAPKQTAKPEFYQGEVVLATGAFDVRKPLLIEQAEKQFRAQVSDIKGAVVIDNVRLIKVNHHVGTSATYVFEAAYTPSLIQADAAPQAREG